MFCLWLQTNIKGVYYEYFEFLQRLYKVYSCWLPTLNNVCRYYDYWINALTSLRH
jgi:hypothetical protein